MLPHDATYLKQFYYEGVDGLKTGYTDLAGYTFYIEQLKEDGKRLITVVMKTDSEEERFKETAKLFDYGFINLKIKNYFQQDYQLEDESTVPVAKGKEETVKLL